MARPIEDEPDIGDPPPGDGGGGGGGGGSGGSPATTIFNINFNKHEAGSVLEILVYANLSSADDFQLIGYLIVDNVVKQTCVINLILDNNASAAQAPMTVPVFLTGLAAGMHNIVFAVLNKEPDSALTVKPGATIKITELKQAAL